jgi:hypothetical protein
MSELETVEVPDLVPEVYDILKAVNVESDASISFAIADGRLALALPCECVATKETGGSDAKAAGVRRGSSDCPVIKSSPNKFFTNSL